MRKHKYAMVMSTPFLGYVGNFLCAHCMAIIQDGEPVYWFRITDKVWHRECHDTEMARHKAEHTDKGVTDDGKD